MSKLIKDLTCAATFSPSPCEFQGLSSRRMVGSTDERSALYYLSSIGSSFGQRSLTNVSLFAASNSDVMLWHKPLGHPSFIYLKTLHPHLFVNKDIHSFHCEHCIYAKQSRTHYPIQSYKTSKPFYLVHSDIRGPARSSTFSGARWFITFIDDHTRVCWVYLIKDKSKASAIFKNSTNLFAVLHSDPSN